MLDNIPEGYEWIERWHNCHLVISKETLRKDGKALCILWKLLIEVKKGNVELHSIEELIK